jgi:hypothetical protein
MKINKISRKSKSAGHPAILIENIVGVRDYICSDIDRSFLLSKKLKTELTQLFGKHNTSFRGEFLNSVWFVEFENEVFQIFTSNRGTEFYCENNNTKIAIDFLKELEQLLINLS